MSDKIFSQNDNFNLDDFVLKEVPLKTEKEHQELVEDMMKEIKD